MTTNLLVPANLADSLTAALAAGYTPAQLTAYQLLDTQYGCNSDADLDFAALFPLTECNASLEDQLSDDFFCEEECCVVRLTPRQAYAMHSAASSFMEGAAPMDDMDGWYLANILPRVCAARLTDPVWVMRPHHVFHVIAARLAAGQVPYPRSTAEEMALHIVLDVAADYAADLLAADWDGYVELPVMDGDLGDGGFEDVRDWAFEDHDVLMLFDLQLDGLESSDLAIIMGMGNLHAREWFTPFRAEDTVEVGLVLPEVLAATPAPLVVRVETSLELVVNDPHALALAAEEDGWNWKAELELDGVSAADTLEDVLARSTPGEVATLCVCAASWLTVSPEDLPGTSQAGWDTSTERSTTQPA